MAAAALERLDLNDAPPPWAQRLFAATTLPSVRVKDWLVPGRDSVVQLSPSFTVFHAAAALHVNVVADVAKLYSFDEQLAERRKVTADTYDAFVGDCRAGRITTVYVFASAGGGSPPLDGRPAAARGGAGRSAGGSTSTGRPTTLQNSFVLQLFRRDGGPKGESRCVLCGPEFVALPHTPSEGAHIVRWDAPIADVLAAGLFWAWDVRNGVLLCKACHTQFDKHLWYVGPDDQVVVAAALLEAADEGVRTYWTVRNGRRLVRPLPPKDASWPLPQTWAVHARGVDGARKRRQAKTFACDVCYHLCKNAKGVQQHKAKGACGRLLRPVFVTPRRPRRGGRGGASPAAGAGSP